MITTAIILAAGASRRLGFPKQLVRVNGVSLVRKVALSLCESGIDRIGVVTGAWHAELEKELAGLNVDLIFNENWKSGLSSSVACGAAWASGVEGVSRSVFLATDQWKVESSDVINLMDEFDKGSVDVVGSSYKGSWGMPLVVSAPNVLSSLVSLDCATPFVPYMEKNYQNLVAVPMEHAGEDLDTPAQLMELSDHYSVTVLRPGSLGTV